MKVESVQNLLGEVYALCWSVERGIKPCSNICVPHCYKDVVIKYICKKHPGLSTHSAINANNNAYTDIHVYKHGHLLSVIENINKVPKSVYHWYLGKLYGISDSEIENFMRLP